MKLPLRYFLIACLLLGAVGVPWGWRQYQKWRSAQVELFEGKLVREHGHVPYEFVAPYFEPTSGWSKARVIVTSTTNSLRNPEYVKWESRMKAIEDRLEELTGARPKRPNPPVGKKTLDPLEKPTTEDVENALDSLRKKR